MPSIPDRPRRPLDHVVAVLVTVHMAMIGIQAFPAVPRLDDKALQHPEVRAEFDAFLDPVVQAVPSLGPKEVLERRVLDLVRGYDAVNDRFVAVSRRWLRPVGGLQTWNMFAGSTPKSPRMLRVEVRPEGSADFVLWLDGTRWGTWPSVGFEHRHRKAQNKLSIGGNRVAREHYAAWWADRWNEKFPDRPARQVRLYYVEQRTRPAARVRAGAEPAPPRVLHDFVWTAPR